MAKKILRTIRFFTANHSCTNPEIYFLSLIITMNYIFNHYILSCVKINFSNNLILDLTDDDVGTICKDIPTKRL